VKHFLTVAILATVLNSFGQVEPCSTYTCDSLAVRAILDSNGIIELPVEAVVRRTGMDGRIGSLILGIPEFGSLPKEIGKLSALEILVIINNQLTSLPPEIRRYVPG